MGDLNKTARHIVKVAQFLTQTKGFNAFSYKDIANEIGIKTSSIHYYFPKKDDLAHALIASYIRAFQVFFDSLEDNDLSYRQKLTAFGNYFYTVFSAQDKLCLCGMLSCEALGLPKTVQDQLRQFFITNEQWLAHQIINLHQDQMTPEQALIQAQVFQAALEGGMLIARTRGQGNVAWYKNFIDNAFLLLCPPHASS